MCPLYMYSLRSILGRVVFSLDLDTIFHREENIISTPPCNCGSHCFLAAGSLLFSCRCCSGWESTTTLFEKVHALFDRNIVVLSSGIKLGIYGASIRRSLMQFAFEFVCCFSFCFNLFICKLCIFLFTDCLHDTCIGGWSSCITAR